MEETKRKQNLAELKSWSETAMPPDFPLPGASVAHGACPMPMGMDSSLTVVRWVPPATQMAKQVLASDSEAMSSESRSFLRDLHDTAASNWSELHNVIKGKTLPKIPQLKIEKPSVCFYVGECLCSRRHAKVRALARKLVAILHKVLLKGASTRLLYDRGLLLIRLRSAQHVHWWHISVGNLNTWRFSFWSLTEDLSSRRGREVVANGCIALIAGDLPVSMNNVWKSVLIADLDFDTEWTADFWQLFRPNVKLLGDIGVRPKNPLVEPVPESTAVVWHGRRVRRKRAVAAPMQQDLDEDVELLPLQDDGDVESWPPAMLGAGEDEEKDLDLEEDLAAIIERLEQFENMEDPGPPSARTKRPRAPQTSGGDAWDFDEHEFFEEDEDSDGSRTKKQNWNLVRLSRTLSILSSCHLSQCQCLGHPPNVEEIGLCARFTARMVRLLWGRSMSTCQGTKWMLIAVWMHTSARHAI